MFFTDDFIFFIKANEDNAQGLRTTLRRYGAASGQNISLEKSCLQFGATATDATKKRIVEILGITAVGNTGKYLGLPTN